MRVACAEVYLLLGRAGRVLYALLRYYIHFLLLTIEEQG